MIIKEGDIFWIFNQAMIVVGCMILFYIACGILKIIFLEKRINALYSQRDMRIKSALQNVWKKKDDMESAVLRIRALYELQINELERKRRFFIDRLPIFY